MDKKFIKAQEKKLREEKEKLEKRLKTFSSKNKNVKDDWITKYPQFDDGRLEEEADEVEEYDQLLSVNYALEIELRKINKALEKIKKGSYGFCEKCGKEIPQERLEIYPQAEYCTKCRK